MEDSQVDTKAKTASPNHVTEQKVLHGKGDTKSQLDTIRDCLSRNKIFFETVAAVVLPLLVIFILACTINSNAKSS